MLSFPNAPFRSAHRPVRVHPPGPAIVVGAGAGHHRGAAPGRRTRPTSPRRSAPSGSSPHAGRPARQLSATEDWAGDGDGVGPPGRLQDRASSRPTARPPAVWASPARCACRSRLRPGSNGRPPSRWRGTSLSCSSAIPVDGTQWRKRYTQWYPGTYQGWAIANDLLGTRRGSNGASTRGGRAWPTTPSTRCGCAGQRSTSSTTTCSAGSSGRTGASPSPSGSGPGPASTCISPRRPTSSATASRWTSATTKPGTCSSCSPLSSATCLLGWADMVNADPFGRTPHDAGSPVDDPWFVVSQYSATRPGEPPLRVDWLDLPPSSSSRPMRTGPTPATTHSVPRCTRRWCAP